MLTGAHTVSAALRKSLPYDALRDFGFVSTVSSFPFVVAVTSDQAWPSLPEVPPASAVLPGFEVRSWLGLAAPAGTPADVVQRLAAETHKALKEPDLLQALASAGSAATPCSPEEMRAMVGAEIARWRGVIQQVGIPLQA
jgi:tripartite-type tricarboxylate transporter receptor subunit TctC